MNNEKTRRKKGTNSVSCLVKLEDNNISRTRRSQEYDHCSRLLSGLSVRRSVRSSIDTIISPWKKVTYVVHFFVAAAEDRTFSTQSLNMEKKNICFLHGKPKRIEQRKKCLSKQMSWSKKYWWKRIFCSKNNCWDQTGTVIWTAICWRDAKRLISLK